MRLIEQLRTMAQAEGSPLSASASDLLLEFEAGPPIHGDRTSEDAPFWRRITGLVNQVLVEEGQLRGA